MSSPSQNLSIWWAAAAMMFIVFVLGVVLLVASYNSAQAQPYSESWDGPLHEIGTCAGPIDDWMRGVREHHVRTKNAEPRTVSRSNGAFIRFVTIIVPWHVEHRPLLLLILGICEVGIVISACGLGVVEKSHALERIRPTRSLS